LVTVRSGGIGGAAVRKLYTAGVTVIIADILDDQKEALGEIVCSRHAF